MLTSIPLDTSTSIVQALAIIGAMTIGALILGLLGGLINWLWSK